MRGNCRFGGKPHVQTCPSTDVWSKCHDKKNDATPPASCQFISLSHATLAWLSTWGEPRLPTCTVALHWGHLQLCKCLVCLPGPPAWWQ